MNDLEVAIAALRLIAQMADEAAKAIDSTLPESVYVPPLGELPETD